MFDIKHFVIFMMLGALIIVPHLLAPSFIID